MYDIDVIDGKRKQRQKKITNDYEIVDKSTLPSAGDLKWKNKQLVDDDT